MAKRTKQDLMNALSWRNRENGGLGVIGASRYKWYGLSNDLMNKVLYQHHIIELGSADEVESAVASMICSQPVASKLI